MSVTAESTEPAARERGKLLGPYRVLHGHRDLALLFSGQVVSAFGDWLYITALIVIAYELTHSATFVAALTFARLLPYVLFLPLGGVLADRFERRRLMIAADLGRAACMIGLLLICTRERIWLAFPLVFLSTCLFSLFRPALGATVPLVAGSEDDLVKANALMTQIDAMSLMVGPALASVLIILGEARAAFVINALTYAVSATTLACLRVRQQPRADEGEPQHWADETLAGFRHLFRARNGVLAAVTLTTAGVSIFNGAIWTLAVVMSAHTWHFGSQGTGFLNASYGLGGLFAGFVVSAVMPRDRLVLGYIVSMAAGIGGIALFGLSPAGILPFAALALFGIGDVANQVAGNTLLQHGTPNELLGRVYGAFEAVVIGALLIGALVTGPLVALIGPRVTTIGIATVAAITLLVYAPRLRARTASAPVSAPTALPVTVTG